ncbi:hypothetical protein ACOME3_001830 [Neoechinorhynchus agilis]
MDKKTLQGLISGTKCNRERLLEALKYIEEIEKEDKDEYQQMSRETIEFYKEIDEPKFIDEAEDALGEVEREQSLSTIPYYNYLQKGLENINRIHRTMELIELPIDEMLQEMKVFEVEQSEKLVRDEPIEEDKLRQIIDENLCSKVYSKVDLCTSTKEEGNDFNKLLNEVENLKNLEIWNYSKYKNLKRYQNPNLTDPRSVEVCHSF